MSTYKWYSKKNCCLNCLEGVGAARVPFLVSLGRRRAGAVGARLGFLLGGQTRGQVLCVPPVRIEAFRCNSFYSREYVFCLQYLKYEYSVDVRALRNIISSVVFLLLFADGIKSGV